MKTYWTKLPARTRKVVLWIFGVLAFYSIVGFLILPPIIRAVAVKQLSEDLGRKVTIQRVLVNPYAPSLTIRGLLVEDKDGKPFLSWDEVYLSFQVSSIFRKAWTFRKITVTNPYLRAQMNKDYTYNFSDLVKEYSTPSPGKTAKKESKPVFVRVKHLQVTDARMSLADFTVRTAFKRVVGPVYLDVRNFSTETNSEGSGYVFGKTDASDYFQWRGNFCLTPLRSAGNAIIYDVTMNKFKPLYEDLGNFEIRSGQSGFCLNYRFEWSPSKHEAVATNVAFGISHFRLGLPGDTNDILDLVHLAQLDTSGDISAHHGEIGRFQISQANIFPERGTNKGANFNFLQIVKPKAKKPVAPGGILVFLNTITNAVASLINSTNKWTGVIHEINFTNCGVHLLDLANGRPATLDLSNVIADAKNISNIPNTNITALVSLDWNKNGRINADLTALISPSTVDIRLVLDQLDLSTLAPYLRQEFNIFIPSADLSLNGDVHLETPSRKLPVITFRGDTWMDHFHAIDGMTGEDLIKWDEIRISGIDANLNPESASIRRISANNVSARVIIETNRTINLLASLKPPTTNAPAQTNAPAVAKTSASTTNAVPPVSISTIAITNAQINFTDRSVTPNVNMVIDDAGGSITGISSAELQHGDLALHALVDGVSPAEITGRINPFSGTLTNQVNIFMTNMDLVPASPYSGKFAGYRIARGGLSVDLRYTLVGRSIQSENVITLNQFTFGDKVDSPTATKLPVRLGIAILKDRQGKIVLNVPIEGNLDDPKFRIRRVVERALANILTRVATSPFSLISAAFGGGSGGGEELSYEDFPPASAFLTDATKRKLGVVIRALYNRPGLQLQISGSVDPVIDHSALQQLAFENEIHTRKWHTLRKSQRATITPDEVVITPKERTYWVAKLYDEALDKGQLTPAMIAANTNLAAIASQIKTPEVKVQKQAQLLTKSTGPASELAGTGQSATTPPPSSPSSEQKLEQPKDPKEALLTAIIPVPEGDLEALALKRARAVRSYILNSGQVEVGRIFLTQNPQGALRQDGSRVYLQLQ